MVVTVFSYIRICEKIEESRHEKGGFCICENKDVVTVKRLCFRNKVRTIHLLPKFEISSLFLSSMAEKPGLCWTWSETPNDRFSHDEAQLW